MTNMTKELIPTSEIDFLYEEDGNVMNPRGAVKDTTDLQASMRIRQENPIEVMIDPETGRYKLLKGHRRLTAARALGWTLIEAMFKPWKADRASQRAMMIADQVSVAVEPSHYGTALARQQIEQGWTLEKLAKLAGKSPRDVELLIALAFAKKTIRDKVDSGEMKISAFAEIANKPESVQDEVDKLDKPTVRNVRKVLAKERIKADRKAKAAQPTLADAPKAEAPKPVSGYSPFASVLAQLATEEELAADDAPIVDRLVDEDSIEDLIPSDEAKEFYNLARRISRMKINPTSRLKIAAAIEIAQQALGITNDEAAAEGIA